MTKEPHYIGHRKRLKDRFLKGGTGALADYELVELLLFLAVPHRDDIDMTKEINDAGKKLGVTLHDHVIVAKGSYASFKSLGLL